MRHRQLGRTGLSVGEIGMGCEGFLDRPYEQVCEYVDIMEQAGANLIDLYAPNPTFRSELGRALEGRRDRFILQAHLCTVWKHGQYQRTRDIREVKESFESQLKALRTDYAEIGMIHYVDSLADWESIRTGPVLEYARQLLRDGKIHHIGLSSHNPEAALAAVNSGYIDVLMFSVNPCYDLQPANEDMEEMRALKNYEAPLVNMAPERQELYETCQRLGVGITVMKAFGGGDLLNEQLSPAGKALSLYQCIHYALTRPGVACVVSGARTPEELRSSIAYETASPEETDYAAAFAQFPRISWRGHCMYCGHCAPCPVGIDVASVLKFLNLAKAQGTLPETVREHYALLEHPAGACISCGSCEQRCPFGVQVMEHMRQAREVFGK